MTPTEVRLTLHRNGYHPLPLNGKAPTLKGWQTKFDTNPDELDLWAKTWPNAQNTGVLCRFTPCLDIDLLDEDAARAVEEFVRDRFEDGGHVLVRIGKSPKRAIPFRTEEPFAKSGVPLIAPNGDSSQKIEFLANGQQFVVAGIHPDTNKPYGWPGKSLLDVPRGQLPYIRGDAAQQLVNDIVALLVREHGYTSHEQQQKKTADDYALGDRVDWAARLSNIIGGIELHDSVRDLAASFVANGIAADCTTRLLQSFMLASPAPHDERWQDRLGDVARCVRDAEAKYARTAGDDNRKANDDPLPYVDITAGLTDREWLVADRVPMFNVTSLFGEGAVGKSIALLQLSAAVVLGKSWFGTLPDNGAVLYYCAEEDAAEINRRLEAIAQHYGSSRQEMHDAGLRVLSFAGRDAILGQLDKDGIIRPTELFGRVKRDAVAQQPKLIVIDPVADAFAGSEIDRTHVRQFVTLMRGLAIDCLSAVVMAAHPSLTGIASGTGLSGSTAWHNSVRARMYFKPDDDDPALRVLEVKKNNYGPVSEAILVRWQDGVYVVVEPHQEGFDLGVEQSAVDKLFITLLRRLTEQGRNVTDKTGTSYAPATLAKLPEAISAKVTSKALAESMERLFAAGKIRVVTEGPQSRQRTRIIEASTDPSTDLPPLPPTLPPHPPYTPPPGGSGREGGGSRPAHSTGQEREEPRYEVSPAPAGQRCRATKPAPYEVLGEGPPGERCVRCGKSGGVKRIRYRGGVDLWHPACVNRHLAALADPPVKVGPWPPDPLDDHGAPLAAHTSPSTNGGAGLSAPDPKPRPDPHEERIAAGDAGGTAANPAHAGTAPKPGPHEDMGRAPVGSRCTLCDSGLGSVRRIRHGGRDNFWHLACADRFLKKEQTG